MSTLMDIGDEQLRADVSRIRSRVEDRLHSLKKDLEDETGSPVVWAGRYLEMLDEWLLDEEQKQLIRLNPWDLFMLHAGAYLCEIDWNDDGHGGAPPSDDERTAGGRCGINRQWILNHWNDLGVRDAAVASALADICGQAECGLAATDGEVREREPLFDGAAVNVALLSSALRLARALSLKSPATSSQVCRLLPPTVVRTMRQFRQAFSVSGAGPHPYLTGTIRMRIVCRDPEIHRALKRHERRIQALLRNINQYASPRFLYSDILFEIEARGYDPLDLKFSVDTSAALKLLTGNRLYSDNRVFLRELIQNAVDACNLRKRLESSYAPVISVAFNDDISRVTVRDNGIGMDRQWIEKYFLTIGISLYQSSEVRSAGRRSRIDFDFISQFGIGFLSSFLVAEKIVIKTRKAGGAGLMITIANLQDYFDVRTIDREFETGTEVTLHLKRSKINYCRSLEYIGYLRTNIRFLEIPVQLRDQKGGVATIGCDKLSYEDPRSADVDFIATLEFKTSQGYVLLRALRDSDHIYAIETAKGGVSVFQDGIFITQLDTLLPQGARQHVIGRINLKGKEKCALSMDRNRIFWTDDQLREIKKIIRLGIAAAANKFVAAVDAQDMDAVKRQSIINNLAVFFDFNEVDDDVHRRLCPPIRRIVEKRFRDFVRIHFAHALRTADIPEADGYSQQWQQNVVHSFRRN